jgi:hypothetical protein
MADHVRIDRVTQGPDGQEAPADRLRVNSMDFLWIYVEATLPNGAAPHGEYFLEVNGKPDPATRQPLEPVSYQGDMYRFSVIHYVLSPHTKYLFHFADNFAAPKYEDSWEIQTI